MASASQQFVEMVSTLGRSREAGLPEGSLIVQRYCSVCQRQGDHVSVEVRKGGRRYEAIECLNCGHRQEYTTA